MEIYYNELKQMLHFIYSNKFIIFIQIIIHRYIYINNCQTEKEKKKKSTIIK